METLLIRTKVAGDKRSWESIQAREYVGLFRMALVEAFLGDPNAVVAYISYKCGGYSTVIERQTVQKDPEIGGGLI